MSALAPVRVGDCPRPDLHPVDEEVGEGHHVFLRPTISLDGGIAAEQAMFEVAKQDRASASERSRALTYAWAPIFVRHGAVGWDICDEDGNPTDFDVEAVLADYAIARLVSNKASELGYGDAVIAPFQTTPEKPSPTTPTPGTTSARPRRTPKSSE